MIKYGEKRDYHKNDVYVCGGYKCSTTWSNGLKQARDKFIEANKGKVHPDNVKVYFSEQ